MLALVLALLLAAPAHAGGGGGMGPNWGGRGATAPGVAYTYIVLPMDRGTLVQAVRRKHVDVDRWRHLAGRWGVPQVALDGTMTGLSTDGKVLVLSEIAGYYPVRRTRLLVLDAERFRVLGRFSFPGRYSVAAISPHGRFVYLRRYTSPYRNPNRSELVVLDRGHPGAPWAVSGEANGMPASAVSDGRWTYTLFQGDAAPWLEGVDTVTRATRRWQLPGVRGDVGLRLAGGRLHAGAFSVAVG